MAQLGTGSALACCVRQARVRYESRLDTPLRFSGSAHWADSCEDMEMGLSECLLFMQTIHDTFCVLKKKFGSAKRVWKVACAPHGVHHIKVLLSIGRKRATVQYSNRHPRIRNRIGFRIKRLKNLNSLPKLKIKRIFLKSYRNSDWSNLVGWSL